MIVYKIREFKKNLCNANNSYEEAMTKCRFMYWNKNDYNWIKGAIKNSLGKIKKDRLYYMGITHYLNK